MRYFSPYCRGRKKVYSTGLPSGAVTLQGAAARVVDLFQLVDGRHQPDLLGLRQLVGQQMFSVKGAPCGLAADHRADTGHRFVQGVCHRQVALAGRRHDGRRADGQKIRPGRLGAVV